MKEEFFGDAALSWYSEEKAILKVRHLENWEGEDNLETAKEVVEGMKTYTEGDQLKGLLIIAPTLYKKKEILDFYQKSDTNGVARALLIGSFAAKIVGNMYLRIAKGKTNEKGRFVPTKLFTEEKKAVQWLREELEAYQKGMPQ